MITIVESDMNFGPYPDDRCFYIEKSQLYKKIKPAGVNITEFLLLKTDTDKPPVLWVVEAKTSAPKKTDAFIEEIRKKMVDTMSLCWAARLGREAHQHAEAELPDAFKTLDLSQIKVKFVLVIKNHEMAWLPPVQDALTKALRSTVKIWGLGSDSVIVLNEERARHYHLIGQGEELLRQD